MPPSKRPLIGSHAGIISWSESDSRPPGEHRIEVLAVGTASAVVVSQLVLTRKMLVRLACEQYSGNAVVRACRRASGGFISRVELLEPLAVRALGRRYGMDPGSKAIENLLTEEQESEFLKLLSEKPSHLHYPSPHN